MSLNRTPQQEQNLAENLIADGMKRLNVACQGCGAAALCGTWARNEVDRIIDDDTQNGLYSTLSNSASTDAEKTAREARDKITSMAGVCDGPRVPLLRKGEVCGTTPPSQRGKNRFPRSVRRLARFATVMTVVSAIALPLAPSETAAINGVNELSAEVGGPQIFDPPVPELTKMPTPDATTGGKALPCKPDDVKTFLNPADCAALPPLKPTGKKVEIPKNDPYTHNDPTTVCDYDKNDPTQKVPELVGYASPDSVNLAGMPDVYRATFADIFKNPQDSYLIQEHATSVRIYSVNSTENAMMVSPNMGKGHGLYPAQVVNVCISGNPATHTVFTKKAVLKETMAHEGAHGMHADWLTFPSNTEDLQQLAAIYALEMRTVAERMRVQKGPQLIQALKTAKATYSKGGHLELARATQKVIDDLKKPGGLGKYLVRTGENDTHYGCHSDPDVSAYVLDAAAELGYKIDSPYPDDADLPLFDEPTQMIQAGLVDAYQSLGEGSVLQGIDSTTSHIEANVSEWLASTYATVQSDPEAVIRAIKAMEPGRRDLEVAKLIIFDRLLAANDPTLYKESYVSYVLAKTKR